MSEQPAALRIRPGMDVYSAYQDQYLGTVAEVFGSQAAPSAAERGATAEQTGSATQAAQQNPALIHEQGAAVSPTDHLGSRKLGEEMGPFPTIAVGNTGPVNQSAGRQYATAPRGAPAGVRYFAVRPGRLNPFAALLYIPAGAVQSISMERVVVDVEKDAIPRAWSRPPD